MTCNTVSVSSATYTVCIDKHKISHNMTITILHHLCYMAADLVLCLEGNELLDFIVVPICAQFWPLFFFLVLAANC